MPKDKPLLVDHFAVGEAFLVTATVPRRANGKPGPIAFEWAPFNPGRLSPQQWDQFRAGRDAVLAKLAKQLAS